MVHIIDDPFGFGPFSSLLRVPVDVPTGWECPRCRRVYSPQTGQCVPCSPPPKPFTGPLPRPANEFPQPFGPFTAVPVSKTGDLPFSPPPVGEPRLPPRHPMCKCVLTPCAPPSEGGMCGCDEPDDGPVLHLPAAMADPAYRRMTWAARDWAEPFPGLQVRLGSYSETERKALLELRLTPDDGQARD